ncbi:TPA: hypothetical protein N6471_004670, partial [Escherichia coli]|nr:hypothetical protein [Escherichia coli]HCN8383087.1 hypothetical protein [Escherichia coli]
AHGQNFARWQMDGWRNNAETARGMSRSPEIWPGRRIVLTGQPPSAIPVKATACRSTTAMTIKAA